MDEFVFKDRNARALALVNTFLGGDDNKIHQEEVVRLYISLSDDKVSLYPRTFIRLKESLEEELYISYVRIYSVHGEWMLEIAWDFNRSGPDPSVKEAPLLYA